ncbi:MAG TPA: 16S rRNA (cytosine(1402)-N(4))-methyltransferase RsmH [Candidatus Hydrogenedentes bacterium]|nr:16S rRNA (cytosine(1402)-N(4))-methyltransferase RsmH [Candidatus Hydrogenedentota bacterium]HPG68092.1 16S rRNA (cytosine(1402)-N(4))-methyltransferase RsmH [Candidatus Hydrogenedentota bacterium]
MGPEAGHPQAPRPEHIPVLLAPAIEGLNLRRDGTYLDATAGGGGHAARIAEILAAGRGRLIAVDRDESAVALVRTRLASFRGVTVVHGNYGEVERIVNALGVTRLDGAIFDAGLSSAQLDDPSRGFSLEREGVLDMRMDRSGGTTAREYLARVSEPDLALVLKTYGDVRPARRIARAIIRRRDTGRMNTTFDLVEAVREALPFVSGIPEETRTTFQSIRVMINQELHWLRQGVAQAIGLLTPGGRIACITFHSGEASVVKEVFRSASRPRRELMADGRVARTVPPVLRLVTAKPIRPTEDEIRLNSRAHSAQLRIGERLNDQET